MKEAIRDVLLARFGQVPEEIEAQLERCTQAQTLRIWHRHAATAPNLPALTADWLR